MRDELLAVVLDPALSSLPLDQGCRRQPRALGSPNARQSLSIQQLLELSEVGGHGVPDTWHGDAPEHAARTAELQLHRVRDPGALWKGVQGIGEAGWERPELALYLQVTRRSEGCDLEALFASKTSGECRPLRTAGACDVPRFTMTFRVEGS